MRLHARIICKTDMVGRESSRCVELGFSKENCSVQLSGGADVYRGRGAIVLNPLKSAAL